VLDVERGQAEVLVREDLARDCLGRLGDDAAREPRWRPRLHVVARVVDHQLKADAVEDRIVREADEVCNGTGAHCIALHCAGL
jgi:hypothetical protein